jgi:PAS domain S-box-containing protein
LFSANNLVNLTVDAQQIWLRKITAIFLLMVLLALGLVGGVTYEGLKTLNRVDREHETEMVSSLIDDREQVMFKLLRDYAEWNDAFRNLHEQPNQQFADENLAFNLTNNYGIALAAVARFDGSVWVQYIHGKPDPKKAPLPSAIQNLIQDLTSPSAEPRRGIVALGLIDGKLYKIGVNFIAALDDLTGQARPLVATPSLLVLARELTPKVLGDWGRVFKIDNLHFTTLADIDPAAVENGFALLLRDADGADIGWLEWRSERSSDVVIKKFVPNLLLAAAVLLTLGGLFFWYVRRLLWQQNALAKQMDRNRQMLKLIFDSDPSHIQVRDKEGRIYFINETAAARYGYSAEQVSNAMLFDIDRDLTRARENYEDDLRTIVTGREHRNEEIWHDQGGQVKTLFTLRRPIAVVDGEIMALIVSSDITEQKRAIQDMAEAKALAEESARAKSEFLTTISHEIRTPMNGILGFAQLLQDTGLSPQQKEYLQIIHNSSKSLLAVINDVLDMSKIEAGKMQLEKTVFDPVAVMESVLAVLRPAADDKNLQLTAEVAGPKPLPVLGDASRLGQILMNILGNAVKFTERGSVQVRLQTMVYARSCKLRFEIADTGIGIDPLHLPKLFDKFSQADSSFSRRYGGTGLGLSIAKQLVELMGGEIGVHSTQGHGSVFWFTVVFDAVQE